MEMITSLAQYITGILLKNNVRENEHLDIYILAFITVILSSVIYMYFIKSTIVMDMAMLSVAVSMIIEKLRKGGCCDEKH